MQVTYAGVFGGADKKNEKKEAAQPEQVSQPQQVPPQIKLYEGEITDEMVDSFLRADAKIRALRQQITQITEQVLVDENIKAEVYMAIAQKMRQDPEFLEQVRQAAAAMVAANQMAQEAEAAEKVTA